MTKLSRQETIAKSLMHSKIIVLPNRDAIARFANEYAPEHLIISMQEPWAMAEKIYAAGSIFIGNYSPESAGDYASGTNHTLPTSRWARSYSALGVESFMRRMTIQELSKEGWRALAVPLWPWLLRRDWTLMRLR
jgi:histidinol dehydrogenase